MSETAQIRELIEAQGRLINQLRDENDRRLKEIEARGAPTAEQTELVNRLNGEITNMQARIDELEAARNRPANPAPGGRTPENAARMAAFLNILRGRPAPPELRNALVEDATGQILVPEDLEVGLRRSLAKLVVVRSLATVRTTTRDRVRRRTITEVAVGWGRLELGDANVESTPVPGEEFLYVENANGLVKIGEDELMDTDADLEGYVQDSFERAGAELEDTGFVIGTGHANKQPEGMLNGATLTRVNTGQAGAITADDLLKLIYAVPAQYRRAALEGCGFLVASTTELAMRLLKDQHQQYLWQPSLQAGVPATFGGFPVYNQEDVPAIHATEQRDVAIFGDFRRGYQVVDRTGMTLKRLEEAFHEDDLVGFKFKKRVGGGVVEAAALRVLRVPAA